MSTYNRKAYLARQKPKPIFVRPGPRNCLGCGKKFKSKGIHNRICDYCKRCRKEETRGLDVMPCNAGIPDLPLSSERTYW